MTKAEFYAWAESKGWTRDRHGHLHKGDMRFKMQAISVRLERAYHTEATQYSRSEKCWSLMRGGYLKDLSINDDGKLSGMGMSVG